jgi:hypothetical protein
MMNPSARHFMKRLLIFLIPVVTIAVIVSEHASSCRAVTNPVAGPMPVCE